MTMCHKNYLSRNDYGFLFAFALAVVFEVVLAGFVVVVEFEVVVDVPLAFVVVLLVVFVVEVAFDVFAVLVTDVLLAAMLVARLALAFEALLAGAASPQAMPRALTARTVESTITFFMIC